MARHGSDVRERRWSSARRASSSGSVSGTAAAWGDPRATSSSRFVQLASSQFNRLRRWRFGWSRSDRRYCSSAAGSNPYTASPQTPLRGGTAPQVAPRPLLELLSLQRRGPLRPWGASQDPDPPPLDNPHPHSYLLPISAALFNRQALQYSTAVHTFIRGSTSSTGADNRTTPSGDDVLAALYLSTPADFPEFFVRDAIAAESPLLSRQSGY